MASDEWGAFRDREAEEDGEALEIAIEMPDGYELGVGFWTLGFVMLIASWAGWFYAFFCYQ